MNTQKGHDILVQALCEYLKEKRKEVGNTELPMEGLVHSENEGPAPDIQESEFSVTIWNIEKYQGRTVISQKSGLKLTPEVKIKGEKCEIICTITDLKNQPKVDFPVDLWHPQAKESALEEKMTDKRGKVAFTDIDIKELPELSLGAGTVDGKDSVKNFHVKVDIDVLEDVDQAHSNFDWAESTYAGARKGHISNVDSESIILRFPESSFRGTLSFNKLDPEGAQEYTAELAITGGPDGKSVPQGAQITISFDDDITLINLPLTPTHVSWVVDTSLEPVIAYPLETWNKMKFGYVDPTGKRTWFIIEQQTLNNQLNEATDSVLPMLHYSFEGSNGKEVATLSFNLLEASNSVEVTAILEISSDPEGHTIPEGSGIVVQEEGKPDLVYFNLHEMTNVWVADTSLDDFARSLETWQQAKIGYRAPDAKISWMNRLPDVAEQE